MTGPHVDGSGATIVLARVVEALRDLADPNFQRRAWIEGSPNEISSPSEVYSALFDDSGLRDALSRGELVFSAEIDRRLAELDRRMMPIIRRFYFLGLDDLKIEIEGAAWLQVRNDASRLLKDISEVRVT
jgi:hypothetical protein